MTREEVMNVIRELAEKLGHTPSRSELQKNTNVTRRQIRTHFGSYVQALRECELERAAGGYKLEMETLFRDWARVVRTLKKIPSMIEYEHLSKYSVTPLTNRFRNWGRVSQGLKEYADRLGWSEEWADVLEIVREDERKKAEQGKGAVPMAKLFHDRTIYGPPISREPLAHGPTNEAGVLFLFGAKAAELGFVVQHMRSEFPDCEAMREVGPDQLKREFIELEQYSRNFLKHQHDISKCDLIICWENNSPECPVEVIELKRFFGKQSAPVGQNGKSGKKSEEPEE